MDQARAAALLFPNCRFVPLDGDIYHFLFGDLSYVDTIIDFLDEDRRRPRAEGLPSGTAIILFADIADSTGLTERLGDRAFRERSKTLDETLRAVIRETGGRPIEGKLLGDGLMAVFASAREAIECGLRCRDTSEASELRLHLGIHAGDVIDEGDNVYGGAVNIASRVAGASEPGDVLVSDTVRGLARTSAEVSFLDRGERELKGVSDPVRLYEVRWQD
jgi:adenylate cyclase